MSNGEFVKGWKDRTFILSEHGPALINVNSRPRGPRAQERFQLRVSFTDASILRDFYCGINLYFGAPEIRSPFDRLQN